jgi:hypothetical protein
MQCPRCKRFVPARLLIIVIMIADILHERRPGAHNLIPARSSTAAAAPEPRAHRRVTPARSQWDACIVVNVVVVAAAAAAAVCQLLRIENSIYRPYRCRAGAAVSRLKSDAGGGRVITIIIIIIMEVAP